MKKKRLVIDLLEHEHNEIGKRALQQDMTIKKWVLLAIASRIKEEIMLGYKK